MCNGVTKTNKPCGARNLKGENYCRNHINQKPVIDEPVIAEPIIAEPVIVEPVIVEPVMVNKKNDMDNLNNNIAAMPPQQTSTNVEQDNQSISIDTNKSAEKQIKTWLKDNADCKYFIEYSLLKKGTQEYLHDVRDAVVMSIEITKGSRRFYWIYKEKSAEAFVQYISLTLKLEAHDIICSPRCRMFFDIDLVLDAIDFDDIARYYNVNYGKNIDTADAVGKTLTDCYFRAMKLSLEAHGIDDSETAGIDYMATMRNRELENGNYKISIHIITNVMFNVSMCKTIIEDIKSDVIPNNIEVLGLPEDYAQLINDAIDAQPYGRNKSLGMPYGFKNKVHQSWVAHDYACAGQKYFLTRCDIMTIQDMIPIGYESNDASVTFDSSSPEFVKRALAHVSTIPDWSDGAFSANPDSLKGAFIQAKRHKSSQCSLCDRCHDNDNTLQLIFNETCGIALWKCIRSKKRAQLFYKEYPDAEDTDLEAFAGKKLAQAGSKQAKSESKRKPVKKQRVPSFDLDDPFDSHEPIDDSMPKDIEEPVIDTSSPHDESLYSLCCLLPAQWFFDTANTWKLARTIYEMPADPNVMRNTYALIMQYHRGEYYNQKRALATYDKDGPSATELRSRKWPVVITASDMLNGSSNMIFSQQSQVKCHLKINSESRRSF